MANQLEQLGKIYYKYVKTDEYEGSLPKPRKLRGTFSITGHPTMLTDGFALDMYATEEPDPHNTLKQESGSRIPAILEEAKVGDTLSRPKYVADLLTNQIFILFASSGDPVGVQTKYYEYFRLRYKGCEFRGKDSWTPIGVIHEGHIVGAIMPVIVSDSIPPDYD